MTVERPNVLWISIEDTSPRFGCYGDGVARTPNIDRLAAQGCRYSNAYSTAGVCAPSRAAIITGMYQTSIGAHHMRTTHTNEAVPELPTPYEAVPPAYVKAFPEYLRAAGYYCTNNNKTDYQFAPPFTAWDECDKEAHWRHRCGDQPFFAVFNFTQTHESQMWVREGEKLETDPARVKMPPFLPDTRKAREALARHYDNIARIDRLAGDLLRELEEDGLLERTVVFFWSDHGDGMPRCKRWPYDSGIHVPLVVRWPGRLEAGSVRDELVSLVDLGPTVLSVAGLRPPTHMQGRPFLNSAAPAREYIHAARDRHDVSYDMVRAVRDARYKYLRNYHPELPGFGWVPYRNRHPVMQELWRLYAEGKLGGTPRALFDPPRPVEELYDLESDPHELTNLAYAPAHSETLERMRAALDAWRGDVGDWGEVPEDRMVAQMWPGLEQPITAPPRFVPICASSPGVDPATAHGTYAAPVVMQIHCPTQGASIGYTLESGETPQWRLYTQPLRLPKGTVTIRAKSIRIGYKESEEQSATFTVT